MPSERELWDNRIARRRRVEQGLELPVWQGSFDLTWNYYVESYRSRYAKTSRENSVYLFHMHIDDLLFVKVGRATDPYRRMTDFSYAFPFGKFEMIRTCRTASIENAGKCEKIMEKACAEFYIGGEWYRGYADRVSELVDSLVLQFEE